MALSISQAESGSDMYPYFSRLPTEVISSIFEIYTLFPDVCQGTPELLLSQMCRHWRDIALGTPSLWTNIHITALDSVHRDKADTYLDRSGALPLSLRIDFLGDASDPIDQICELFTSHIDRWLHLRVFFVTVEAFERFIPLLSTSYAPNLRSCHLDVADHNDNQSGIAVYTDNSETSIFASGAPSLVSFGGRGLALHRWRPPLGKLTDLRIHDPAPLHAMSFAYFASILNDMVSLRHLIIVGDIMNSWTTPATIILPCLLSFHVRANFQRLAELLGALRAPLLHSLLLEDVLEIGLFSMTHDIGRSAFPSLRFLTLIPAPEFGVTEVTWWRLFAVFPTITDLTLVHPKIHPFLIAHDRLTGPELPWPELSTVSLIARDPYIAGLNIQHLDNFVSSRMERQCPIKKLQLSKSIFAEFGEPLQRMHPTLQLEDSTPIPQLSFEESVVNWPFD